MAANFPTSLDDAAGVGSATGPVPNPTDAVDNPPHAELHQKEGDAIIAVESKIGIGSSSPTLNAILTGTATGSSAWSNSFTGAVTATSGSFTGAVYASSGSFTGAVTATSGSFTGAVYASSGSFTGAVTATSGSFTGAVYASSGSFVGTVNVSDSVLYFGPSGTNDYIQFNDTINQWSFVSDTAEVFRIDSGGTIWPNNVNVVGRTLYFGGSTGTSSNDYIQFDDTTNNWSVVSDAFTHTIMGTAGIDTAKSWADGGLHVGQVFSSSYEGVRTGSQTGSEYMIMSDGTNTFISAGVGGGTYIRPGNNLTSGEINLDGTWCHVNKPAFSGLPAATASDYKLYVTSAGEVRKNGSAGL